MAAPTAPTDPQTNLASELDGPPAPTEQQTPMTVSDQQPADAQPVENTSPVAEDLDDIEKQIEPRVWKFAGEFNLVRSDNSIIPQVFDEEYVQKPLSYFAFLEFTGLIAKKIEEAMHGDDGLKIQDVIQTSEGALPFLVDGKNVSTVIQKGDFQGVDAFVQGLFKVASYVPDVIEECQFIWLRVPRKDRAFLREIWGRSPDDGGMTNDEGEEMLSLFIDQNYEELEAFFVERLPRILKVMQKARKRIKVKAEQTGGSQRSRLWRDTPALTPSQ